MRRRTMMLVFMVVTGFATTTHAVLYSSIPDADAHNRSNFADNNFGRSLVIDSGAVPTNRYFWNSFLFWDLPDDLLGQEVLSGTLTVPLRCAPYRPEPPTTTPCKPTRRPGSKGPRGLLV